MPFDNTEEWTWAEQNLAPEHVALFRRLVAWLDAGGDEQCKFNYSIWECGTAACVGGWLDIQLFGPEYKGDNLNSRIEEVVDILDMDPTKLSVLFLDGYLGWYENGVRFSRTARADEAASCVRHFMRTGEVDWERAFKECALDADRLMP